MKDIKVVIGKNFGDEGKGQTVSDLCKGQSALVIRHNGGAQAGHTVEEGDYRFVFHQLGSGSIWGCPTYWSHTFLPDLWKLGEEVEAFGRGKPGIYAHPDCRCTVIYDVLLNSLTELLRGEERHGSCGMGIYEAVLRSRRQEYALRLGDFGGGDPSRGVPASVEEIADRLLRIRQGYTLPRLEELRGQYGDKWREPQIQEWVSLIEEDDLVWNAAEEMCGNYRKYVQLAELGPLVRRYGRIVFENAQGLMLDEDNRAYYPHLTPSHTGLYNVVRLLEKMPGDVWEKEAGKRDRLEVIYVTRTYITRHGAGRLDHECTREAINPRMVDRTNLPNPWQNSLRYARHPAKNDFFGPVRRDLQELDRHFLTEKLQIDVTFRLTHLDETDGRVLFADGSLSGEEFEKFWRGYL